MFVCPECGRSEGRAGTCTTDGTELQPTSDPLLGTEISRYRLARTLGEGGMGRVYLAVQPAIGSRVAIKVLSEECTRSPDLLERFFAEAKAVNLIRHENIISVLDLATLPDGRPYIIMEFIAGYTLSHYVKNTHAPLGGVAQVVGEVLSGLAAAHAIGIVHRDLKPDNVLVTGEGHAKVLDFGIAKLAPGLRADISPRTKTGALLGTPAYMAPEQISGAQNVDARTDIYAAGVVLYEAVTGSAPFSGATLFDIMRAHLELEPQRPRERRADIPPALEHVILQALAKDPSHRFQSAAAMAQALQHATASLPAEQWRPLSTRGGARISASGIGHRTTQKDSIAPRSVAVAPTTQAPHRRTGLLIGVLAAAAIAVGIVLFAVAGDNGNPPAPATTEVAGTAPLETPPVASPSPSPSPAPSPAPAQTATPVPSPSSASAKGPAPAPAKPAQTRPAQAKPAGANPTVTIGPNVTTGPGVVIGATPTVSTTALPRTTISKPADYDPSRFDPVGYLPKALALARQLLPDARLTSFEFDPVFPDGRVDLTKDGRDREYLFRSPSKSARPADVPRNMPVERACMVYVEVGTREITATIRKSEDCDAKLVRHPTCRFSGVWKQAIKNGTPTDVVARVGWLFDEQWFFDVDLEGKGGGVSSFPDRCP